MSLQAAHTEVSPSYVGAPRADGYATARHALPEPRTLVAGARGVIEATLRLRHAGPREVRIRYERVGDHTLPVVLVAGGISAHRHVLANASDTSDGWWPSQVGEGRAIDPARVGILALDWIGADGLLDAPLDPADQADAIAQLLDALRIPKVDAFVGASYGAMVGLQFAARHGPRLGRLVAISGAHRAHPFASAWRALQRRAIALGSLQCDATHGVALARQLALLTYRTPEEFAGRFGCSTVVRGQVRVGAEDYLDHCGASFAQRMSPVAYQRLSESIDLQQLEPECIRVPVTAVAIADDRLVPLADVEALVARLGGDARLRVLASIYGHDAFLKEESAIDEVLRDALEGAGA